MNGVETLMWRLGRHDPRWLPTMSLVVALDGPLDRDDLMRRLTRLCRVVPRLQKRVREASFASAPPAWEHDQNFSVDAHVTEEAGPLWDVVGAVISSALPLERPPWRAVIVNRDPGQVVLHLHHSYTDGQGGLRLVAELFDFAPEGTGAADQADPADPARGAPSVGPDGPGHHLAPPASAEGPVSALRSLVDDVAHEGRRSWEVLSRAAPWAGRTLVAGAWRPAELTGSAGTLLSSVRVNATAATGPASPILTPRGAGVTVAPVHLHLELLRATARTLGVTVNDVFVAGLLDALARYHALHGMTAPSLRVGLPISHRRTDEDLRNQIFGAVIRGPLGRLDFAERCRLLHEIVLHGRQQPWAALIEDAAGAAVRLPGLVAVVASAMASMDLLASNVIGSPVPMWLGRSRVETMVPVGPRSGAAINATLLSYCSDAAIGLNLDPAAVPDPAVLSACIRAAFEEGLTGSGE